jgi:regulator of replication initiation timing
MKAKSTTRYTHTSNVVIHQVEPKKYTGVLFRFGELSLNGTGVKRTATVRACSDAINIEHKYPPATEYKAVGHIERYYYKDDALYIDFVIHDEFCQKLIENQVLALSVSWFSDAVEVIDGDQWFDDLVIYEVSLVAVPAFNTCAAPVGEALPCMHSEGGCGCGGKRCKKEEEKVAKNVYLDSMVAKHQEEERLTALEQALQKVFEDIAGLQQQVADIIARLDAMEMTISQMKEQADTAVEEAKAVASKVEELVSDVAKSNHNLNELAKLTHKLTTNLANLIRK